MIEVKKLYQITYDQIISFGTTLYSSESRYEIKRQVSGDEISFKMTLVQNTDNYVKYTSSNLITEDNYNLIIDHGYSLGAFHEDKMIGYMIAEDRKWNNSVWIEMIRVAKDYKGYGIGSSMLSTLESLSKECFKRSIEIETQNMNVPAINFYKKNGFKFTGLNMTLYDPEECDDEIAVYMSKDIEQSYIPPGTMH